MARIAEFFEVEASGKFHPTEVEFGFSTMTVNGATFLELRTHGSDTRASKKKVSQSLQLDQNADAYVLKLIVDAFPDLRNS